MTRSKLPPNLRAELNALEKAWKLLEPLSEHAKARVMLFVLRKHQNSGDAIDLRALERQAIEPRREDESDRK